VPRLPAHPNLDQLRRQAKDLLRAAGAGDADAVQQLRLVSDRVTLSAAQLALARGYGFASWPALKAEVEARTLALAEQVDAFLGASIGDGSGRAARLLASTPEIAGYSFAPAVVLGDAERVRAALQRDPGLATRVDQRTGWTPLHAVCASRWHQFEPARSAGLLAVARLLLDAGAAPTSVPPTRPGWSPLRCVIAGSNSGPSNRPIAELLLAHGAVPNDHDLYLAGFAHDRLELLELLLAHVASTRDVAEQALAAPLSKGDVDAARLLLDAGADPNRYRNDDGDPAPVVWTAIRSGCSAAFVELLLDHDADPNAAGPDERTPYRLATAAGRADLAELLRHAGADTGARDVDTLLSACMRADRAEARRLAGVVSRLTDDERAMLVRAAEAGNTAAVALMLDLGFPLDARGDNGATALHAAAYSGNAEMVRLLLGRGADVEARDTTWDSTPAVWANVGREEQRDGDWDEIARILGER
jgi:ankyrin repeat protein